MIDDNLFSRKKSKTIKVKWFFTMKVKQGYLSFMDHPRTRVAHEERASIGPSIIFRWLYKFGIKGTTKDFEKATAEYRAKLKTEEANI